VGADPNDQRRRAGDGAGGRDGPRASRAPPAPRRKARTEPRQGNPPPRPGAGAGPGTGGAQVDLSLVANADRLTVIVRSRGWRRAKGVPAARGTAPVTATTSGTTRPQTPSSARRRTSSDIGLSPPATRPGFGGAEQASTAAGALARLYITPPSSAAGGGQVVGEDDWAADRRLV